MTVGRPRGLRGFGRQVVQLSVGRGIGGAIAAVWLIIAARELGTESFGDLSLILTLGLLVGSLGDFGFSLLVTGDVADQPAAARAIVLAALVRRVPLAAVAACLVAAMYLTSAANASVAVAATFGASLLATAIYATLLAYARGDGRTEWEAVNEVASRVLVLGAGAVWLDKGGGLLAAVAVYALADTLSAVVVGRLAYRSLRDRREPVVHTVSLKRAAPLGASVVAATLYYRVDVWLLASLDTSRSVGLYAAASRLTEGLLIPAAAIGAISLAATSNATWVDRARILKKLTAVAFGITLLPAAAVALFAPAIVVSLLGPSYEAAAPLLQILMLSLVPGVAIAVIGPRVTAARGQQVARLLIAVLVVNVLANVVAIPRFGPAGAAFATVGSQFLLLVLLLQLTRGLQDGRRL